MTQLDKESQVDLIGMAYENARAEGVQLHTAKARGVMAGSSTGYIKVIAPAKVNLYLGVQEKVPGGYHPVENVMHTLLLHDVVYMRCMPLERYAFETGESAPAAVEDMPGLHIHLTCSGVGAIEAPAIAPEENIVYKAIVRLAAALGRAEEEVMDVHLEKHVPHQAGLGGGSADAAAALVGAAQLWGVDAACSEVTQVAQDLGADVAFFLTGGCALYENRGEKFVRALTPRKDSVVLIKPAAGLSTAAVYNEFDVAPVLPTGEQQSALTAAQTATEVPLFNGLAPAAERVDAAQNSAELAAIREWAQAQPGVVDAMLTGSGSCTFAICENSASALKLSSAAQTHGWWATSTFFTNIRAAVGK